MEQSSELGYSDERPHHLCYAEHDLNDSQEDNECSKPRSCQLISINESLHHTRMSKIASCPYDLERAPKDSMALKSADVAPAEQCAAKV